MQTLPPIPDQTRDMDEKTWWDLWNTSYRTGDDIGEIPNQLFACVAAIVNEITQIEPCRVLEIGCGTGTLSRRLACSGYHGVDISPAAINIARQKSECIRRSSDNSFPTYEAADFHDWPPPPDLFDLVVCVDAVMCFRDQRHALSKIAHCLRAHGLLVLTAINPFVYHRIRRTPTSPLDVGPVNHWLSRRELHELIRSAGLRIERSYTIMPRGNSGILRLINARRVNEAFGPHVAGVLRRLKERVGLGQYRIVVAQKD